MSTIHNQKIYNGGTGTEGQKDDDSSLPVKFVLSYIELIFRIFDELGTKGIDMFGSFMQLNVNGKKISEQEPMDLISGLSSLTNKLTDPNVKAALFLAIEKFSPIVKESAKKFLNIYIQIFKTGLVSAVAVACEVPPLSVMCGMSKSATAFLELAAKSMGFASSSIDDVKKIKETSKEVTNVLNGQIPLPSPGSIQMPEIQMPEIQMPNSTNLLNETTPVSIQAGGERKIMSSLIKQKKAIEKRIGGSIQEFNNPTKYYNKKTETNKKGKLNKNKNKKTKKSRK